MTRQEQLLELLKIAKQMKKDIICIQKDCIMGTDSTFTTYSELYYNSDKFDEDIFRYNITIVVNDMVSYLRKYEEEKDFRITVYGFINNNPYDASLYSNQDYYIRLLGLRNRSYNYKNIGFLAYNNFELSDENFMSAVSIKTKDGAVMYKLDDRHIMSTFSKIHPLNKADKISVSIYDMPDKTFLSIFHIQKKNCYINEFIRYRLLV